jgi:hypothetical protein
LSHFTSLKKIARTTPQGHSFYYVASSRGYAEPGDTLVLSKTGGHVKAVPLHFAYVLLWNSTVYAHVANYTAYAMHALSPYSVTTDPLDLSPPGWKGGKANEEMLKKINLTWTHQLLDAFQSRYTILHISY